MRIEIVVGVAFAVKSPGFDFVFFDEIDAFSAAGGVDFFDDLGVVVVEGDVNFFFSFDSSRFSFFSGLFVGFDFAVVILVVVIFIVIIIVVVVFVVVMIVVIIILIITNISTIPLPFSFGSLMTTKTTNSGIAKNQSAILARHPQISRDSLQFECLDGMSGSNGNRGEISASVADAHEAAGKSAFNAGADGAFHYGGDAVGFDEFVA